MREWEVRALGHPHGAAVLDTNTGRAVCLSFKHTMHVIQTSLSAHKGSVQPCPPPSATQTDRKGTWPWNVAPLRIQLPAAHPPLPDSPRRPPDEGGCLRSRPSSGCKCFESKMFDPTGLELWLKAKKRKKKEGRKILEWVQVCVTQASVVRVQNLCWTGRGRAGPASLSLERLTGEDKLSVLK